MNLVRINDLYVEYKSKKGVFGEVKTIHAVNGVSLDIKKGERVAIVGENLLNQVKFISMISTLCLYTKKV